MEGEQDSIADVSADNDINSNILSIDTASIDGVSLDIFSTDSASVDGLTNGDKGARGLWEKAKDVVEDLFGDNKEEEIEHKIVFSEILRTFGFINSL